MAIRIAPDYPPGGRNERAMELILDELQVLPILALHVPQSIDPRPAALCHSLRAEPAAGWSLSDATRRLGVSPQTLTRIFRCGTGPGFAQWLWRMYPFASLDALTVGRSILEAALDLGYDNRNVFSAIFRRTLGVSPSPYSSRDATYGVAGGNRVRSFQHSISETRAQAKGATQKGQRASGQAVR